MCFHHGGHTELRDRMFHNYPFINNAQHFFENGIVLFGKDEMKQKQIPQFWLMHAVKCFQLLSMLVLFIS